jgi:hypothetical protein
LVAVLLAAVTGSAVQAAVVQDQGLRITVLSQILPYKLPRHGTAPIAVFVSGHIATPSGSVPPQLQRMTVDVNRRGLLQSKGLPTCTLGQVQPATDARALSQCQEALVGSGRFWASIVLPDQRPYPTRGRLLIFNGRQNGKPVLFAHIYTQKPFATSFVIVFSIAEVSKGPYGTELSASLPQALGTWGFVDRIKLTLRRRYRIGGEERSYFNAGCPAPSGTNAVVFPLARAEFFFAEQDPVKLAVSKACRVKE